MSLPTTSQEDHSSDSINPPRPAGYLTVVDTAYYQPADDFPITLLGNTVCFSRALSSEERPYERVLVVSKEWSLFDLGWIRECSMLLIRNDEGKFQAHPSREQRDRVLQRVVEISFSENVGIIIPPGESCRFCPANIHEIKLRCRVDTAKCRICLVPR